MMSSVFDDIISESEGKSKGMVDVGLGEPQGCDPLARKNTIALNERMKLESTKISKLASTVDQLESTVQELMVKVGEMARENSLLRAQVANGLSSVSGEAEELPAHLR